MTCYKTYKSWGQQMYEIGVPNYDLIGDIHSYFRGKPLWLFSHILDVGLVVVYYIS
jgi:hypothetical protein